MEAVAIILAIPSAAAAIAWFMVDGVVERLLKKRLKKCGVFDTVSHG